jgi:hypothetical protein
MNGDGRAIPLYRPYARKGIGASLGEGLNRDYAMYQGRAIRAKAGDGAEKVPLKMELLRLAEQRRKSPHDGTDRAAIESG